MQLALVYPHQVTATHPGVARADEVWLVEDPLYFTQYHFHSQKLVLHRASMAHFADQLRQRQQQVRIVGCGELPTSGAIVDLALAAGATELVIVDPHDDWLQRRVTQAAASKQLSCRWLEDEQFLTANAIWDAYHPVESRWFFTDFLIQQRKRLKILVDAQQRPVGGKWSFDTENRRRLPARMEVPPWPGTAPDAKTKRAIASVQAEFPQAPGDPAGFRYAVTPTQARRELAEFVEQRLHQFGDYEDAISTTQTQLFHAVLTPALNIGLVSPTEVVEAALAQSERVPLNSLEGFVRQVIGWREFVRGVYRRRGRIQRTRNFWNFQHVMPRAFYEATTGIEPVDAVIQRVRQHAYCHHIERLMVLGNFMLLCEIHPDAVYRWFMELFVDAYDWVMVPNVYGMSQYADGGLMTTKPYISGSSYILKMSDFPRGPWCAVWDALYWRFIDKHREVLSANPRMSLMVAQLARLGPRLKEHRRVAEEFLTQLHANEPTDNGSGRSSRSAKLRSSARS